MKKEIKKNGKKVLLTGVILLAVFVIWTALIQMVDVRPLGVNGTDIGFSTINVWFHNLTGTDMLTYTITDWMGVIPIIVCMGFGVLGLVQLIGRKSLLKVDKDILILGVYYIFVIMAYVLFELIPINYRPILIEGYMEASYPSSTTLLVMSVMPTLIEQINRRLKGDIKTGAEAENTGRNKLCRILNGGIVLFSVYTVIGRLLCGVHWLTDILGSVFLSAGLFLIYKGLVLLVSSENGNQADNPAIKESV